MAWNDRLRESAYTSPGGIRTVFIYEDVSKSIDKKTTAFNFPDANGTYVQDLGHSGRRYPLQIIFWGDDYDLQAESFENSLLEKGVGILEHPIYGQINVVPFGSISRRDDLKTQANQTVIKVEFFETIGIVYPSIVTDNAAQVDIAVAEFNQAAAEEFDGLIRPVSTIEKVSLENDYLAVFNQATSALDPIARATEKVKRQFDNIKDSINASIKVLVADPLTLAFQTAELIQAPGRAAALIADRLTAYKNLADQLTTGDSAIISPGFDSVNSNKFHSNDLFAMSYITGSIVSVLNNEFITKTDALGAADEILTQLDSVVVWRDDNYESLSEIDTGEAYQKLQDAVAITAGYLVQISFTLKQERSIILDRNRNFVELCAELYGELDSQFDFLINTNNLTGSELIEIPRGREIVYYV